MKMKSLIIYAFIAISLCILASFFPLTGIDITWSLKNIDGLLSVLRIEDASLITASLTTLLINNKLIKVITVGLLGASTLAIMGNTVDKKDKTLVLIAFFLFFLLDRSAIAATIVQINGFSSYFVGSLCLLLFANLIIKDTIPNLNYLILFVLGIILSNLELPYALTSFAITLIYLNRKEDKFEDHSIALFLGELLGLITVMMHSHMAYTGFSHNLIHELIPTICETNFIIILIFSALIMIEALKIYMNGKTRQTTIAIFGIGSFLFSSLLSSNDYVNYITYIIYSISSIYVLLNMSNSSQFKRKIGTYYLFKFIFILMLGIFGNVTPGYTTFFSLIDIVIILEFYSHILPSKFLEPVWFAIAILIASINIYIYRNASLKYAEMNFYIKNKLECTTEDIILPSKYENAFLIDYVPDNRNATLEYIDFYDIDLYDKDKNIKFQFRNPAR